MYPVRIIFSLLLYVSFSSSIALALYRCLWGDGIGKVGAREQGPSSIPTAVWKAPLLFLHILDIK